MAYLPFCKREPALRSVDCQRQSRLGFPEFCWNMHSTAFTGQPGSEAKATSLQEERHPQGRL